MAKEKTNKKDGEVVVNLDNFGVPLAIIISGVIIASVIFFTSKSNTVNKDSAGNPTGEIIAEEDEFEEATVMIGDDDPILGDKDSAKVAIIEFSDYMCGYCQRHTEETFPLLLENYIDSGKILYIFKEFPLSNPGDDGFNIAEGASCIFSVAGTDAFTKYHNDAFFLESKEKIISLAVKSGADENKFVSCLDNSDRREEVSADLDTGRDVGISGTPGFVVGKIKKDGSVEGHLIFGAYPYETFEEAIESYL